MDFGKRFAQAGALTVTVAMAAIVGTAQASPLPPKSVAAPPGAMAAPAPEPAPAVPTFVNGSRQNVFSAATADWISGEVWVSPTWTPTATASSTACTRTTRCPRRRRPTA